MKFVRMTADCSMADGRLFQGTEQPMDQNQADHSRLPYLEQRNFVPNPSFSCREVRIGEFLIFRCASLLRDICVGLDDLIATLCHGLQKL